MNKKEALKAMLDGNKVTSTKWEKQDKHFYCYWDDEQNCVCLEDGDKFELASSGEMEWKIWEEPKPKIKKYLWMIKRSEKELYQITTTFFKDEEEVKLYFGDVKVIQKCEWPMIEVDE